MVETIVNELENELRVITARKLRRRMAEETDMSQWMKMARRVTELERSR